MQSWMSYDESYTARARSFSELFTMENGGRALVLSRRPLFSRGPEFIKFTINL